MTVRSLAETPNTKLGIRAFARTVPVGLWRGLFGCRALVLLGVLVSAPVFAVQRAYVSALNGNDSNTSVGCPADAPCRWFAGAVTVVDSDGEVVAKDSGAYGTVTLNKSVSLTAAPGVYAGITVFSGNGVTIATAGVRVVLKGLTINGFGGERGVYMTNGAALSVENCTFSNFTGAMDRGGIFVNSPTYVTVLDTTFRHNYRALTLSNGAMGSISRGKFFSNNSAVVVTDEFAGAPATSMAVISRSIASGGAAGFTAYTASSGSSSQISVVDSVVRGMMFHGVGSGSDGGGISEASVRNSLVQGGPWGPAGFAVWGSGARLIASGNAVVGNGVGLSQQNSGVLESAGDNVVRGNSTPLSGSITTSFGKM